MGAPVMQRFYPIANLNFRDFWDICSHFQRVNKQYHVITYTVEGDQTVLAQDETDVSVILRKLSQTREQVRKIVARFYTHAEAVGRDYGNSKLMYLPALSDFQEPGLYYYSDSATKLSLYKFEDILYSNYQFHDAKEADVEFGVPCEVLAAVVDMRGFSAFCEQPNIESPYTCGVMTAFYHMVRNSLNRYPPEMIKFLGDGVLTVWQTGADDRSVAIEVCMEGILSLNRTWAEVRKSPHFTHGAPKDIGVGISFGLASRISVGNDYIGRPINLASRLCGVCQAGQALIDKSVPGISGERNCKEVRVRIKSFGDYPIWSMMTP